MITHLFTSLKQRIEKQRQYRKAIAEISALTEADLMEIGAFQIDLYRAARQEILG